MSNLPYFWHIIALTLQTTLVNPLIRDFWNVALWRLTPLTRDFFLFFTIYRVYIDRVFTLFTKLELFLNMTISYIVHSSDEWFYYDTCGFPFLYGRTIFKQKSTLSDCVIDKVSNVIHLTAIIWYDMAPTWVVAGERLRHLCPNNQQVVQDDHRLRKPLFVPTHSP